MAQAVRRSSVQQVPPSEIQNRKPPDCWSTSRPRMTGSTICSKMTRGFSAASNVRARGRGRVAEVETRRISLL
jgi:hypothetical protein